MNKVIKWNVTQSHKGMKCWHVLQHGTTLETHRKNPDTKGYTLYYSIYIKYSEEANPQRQTADEWRPGAGGREGMRNDCLMGTRSPSDCGQSSGVREWWWMHDVVGVSNATELLYTFKWLKWWILCYVYLPQFFKKWGFIHAFAGKIKDIYFMGKTSWKNNTKKKLLTAPEEGIL